MRRILQAEVLLPQGVAEFFLSLDGSSPTRKELLGVRGVGEETADSILLYGYRKPEFVVDAYTRRIFSRLGVIGGDERYSRIKELFEDHLKLTSGSSRSTMHSLSGTGRPITEINPTA